VVWREVWDHAFDLFQSLSHDDLHTLHNQVDEVHHRGNALHATPGFDIWAYQGFRQAVRPIFAHPYWSAVTTLQTIQRQLLDVARTRYRAQGKVLTGTKEYKQWLQWIANPHCCHASDATMPLKIAVQARQTDALEYRLLVHHL
jgi:hypothetical protein